MKRILKSLFILSIFSISLIALSNTFGKNVFANTNTSISFRSDKTNIVASDTFNVIVSAKNVSDLYGASIDFKYDTSMVKVIKVENASGFSNALSPQIVKNDVKNGLLSFYSTFTGNKSGLSSLNSDLFKITLQAKQDGVFFFNSSNKLVNNSIVIKLSDSNASKIPFTAGNFSTNITKRSNIKNITSNLTDNTTLVNNTVKITTTADSKYNPIKYKFWVKKDNGNWEVLSDYSSQNYINWKPTEAGNYTISSYIKSSNSPLDPDDCKILKIKVLDNNLIDKVSVDNSITNPNQTINVQASAKSKDLLYKFWLRDGDTWKVIQDYSSSNKTSFKIPKVGSYKISVYAKSKYSSLECDDLKIIDVDVLPKVTLNISKESSFVNGDSVKLTANTDYSGNYEYKFWALENGTWKVIQDYSNKNTALYKPSIAGNTKVSVYVRNKNSDNVVLGMNSINIFESSINIDSSNLNEVKKPNDIVNLKVSSNNPNAEFKFWVLENGVWKVIQDYSKNNSLNYKIPSTGNYRFSVYVKDKNSSKECDSLKILDLSILPSVKLGISSKEAFVNGTPVTLIANTDFPGNYEYKFWALENGNWHVIQNYSNKNTVQYLPKTLGETKVSVYVKNKNSDEISMSMNSLTLLDTNVKVTKNNLNSITKPGDTVNLTVDSNNPNAEFKFWVLKDGKWNVIQNYSTKNSVSYKIPSNGDYRFSIYVKDKNSKSDCDTFKILDLKVK